MKQYQNTLFVTTQGARLRRDGQTIVVKVQDEIRMRIPVHTISGVVCFGRIYCSPSAMELCSRNAVPISWLNEYGRFLARVEGPISGNVLLRRQHYRLADDNEACSRISRAIVSAKVANSRTVLLRALRDYPDMPEAKEIERAAQLLRCQLAELEKSPPLETIRGIEGESARCYFEVFNHLIRAQKDEFFYFGRTRRPPMDNMNALLSFLYSLLALDAASALQAVGLDPAVGFLHRDRPGRPGLALDLMEEFRAFLGDRLALSLVNLRQVQASGFHTEESGAVRMDEATRKTILVAWQKRKQEEIQHPFLGERMSIALLLPTQALLMARHLRGDLDDYPAFIWK